MRKRIKVQHWAGHGTAWMPTGTYETCKEQGLLVSLTVCCAYGLHEYFVIPSRQKKITLVFDTKRHPHSYKLSMRYPTSSVITVEDEWPVVILRNMRRIIRQFPVDLQTGEHQCYLSVELGHDNL